MRRRSRARSVFTAPRERRYFDPAAAFLADIGDDVLEAGHVADVTALGTGAFENAVFAERPRGVRDPEGGVLGAELFYQIGQRLGGVGAEAGEAVFEVGPGQGTELISAPEQFDLAGAEQVHSIQLSRSDVGRIAARQERAGRG